MGSLWGAYDERAESSSFQDAIKEWRGGAGPSTTAAPPPPRGSLLAAAASPSDPSWRPSAIQCCWECLRKFTDRGHWSTLAGKQFCGRDCSLKYEKSRRLKPAPPPPHNRKVACQRCFNLCSEEDDFAAAEGAGGGYYCGKMCAALAGMNARGAAGGASAAAVVAESAGAGAAAPPGAAPSGRAPRSAAAAGMTSPPTITATARAVPRETPKASGTGRVCPECDGAVNILQGAVGVVTPLGRALVCGRTCADALLARPIPDPVGKDPIPLPADPGEMEGRCLNRLPDPVVSEELRTLFE